MARKPTKCFYCPDVPSFLVSAESDCHPACGMSKRPVCVEHARGFVLSLFYDVEAIYDIPPRVEKKRLAAEAKKR